jgi:hypothetical protein
MVGREGAWNASAALDGRISLNKGVVQMSGVASVIAVDALRIITDQYKPFRSLLMHHEQVVFAEAQQSAACNAIHLVQPRMCRWLLRMRDLTDSDDLMLTQDFLAQMLGVQRTSVTLTALALQEAGFIEYRRGRIRILDRAALIAGTCECYETVKSHYGRLHDPDQY